MIDELVTEKVTIEMPETPKPSANGAEPKDGPTCGGCGAPMTPGSGRGMPKRFCKDSCKQAHYREMNGADIAKRESGRAVQWTDAKVRARDGRPLCGCGCGRLAARGRHLKFKKYASDACRHRASRKNQKEKANESKDT